MKRGGSGGRGNGWIDLPLGVADPQTTCEGDFARGGDVRGGGSGAGEKKAVLAIALNDNWIIEGDGFARGSGVGGGVKGQDAILERDGAGAETDIDRCGRGLVIIPLEGGLKIAGGITCWAEKRRPRRLAQSSLYR